MTITAAGPPTRTAPTQGEPAVQVRGLVKRYAGRAVVDGLDVAVRRGESFALLGPDGAGKTIEILEGVRRRDEGSVGVLGEDRPALVAGGGHASACEPGRERRPGAGLCWRPRWEPDRGPSAVRRPGGAGARRPPGRAYLVVHVLVFVVLAWEQPSLLFLMFLAYPQVWFLVESVREEVSRTVALALASTIGPVISWSHGTEPPDIAGTPGPRRGGPLTARLSVPTSGT